MPNVCPIHIKEPKSILQKLITSINLPCNGLDVACVTTTKHDCRNSIVFCVPYIAPRNGQEVSYFATSKH